MKKKQQKKIRTTEKANAEIETPKNIDFIEIPMTNEALDKVVHKNAHLLAQQQDPDLRKKTIRKQERLLKKIFKAATQALTDPQYQIFLLRYAYRMPEEEIVKQVGCKQSYIPSVLKTCIKKIQKQLRIPVSLKGFSSDNKFRVFDE